MPLTFASPLRSPGATFAGVYVMVMVGARAGSAPSRLSNRLAVSSVASLPIIAHPKFVEGSLTHPCTSATSELVVAQV